MSGAIRVLVVDDDAFVRAGLRTLLECVERIALVGEAEDGDEVVQAVAETAPDVVLMDVRMPRLDGLAATEALRAVEGAPKVIVLTAFDVEDELLRALRAGASGFLLKSTEPARIVRAIEQAAIGEPVLCPAAARRLIAHVVRDGGDARRRRSRAALTALGEREREVARAVGQGLANAQVAAQLFMSVATVKAHVSSILHKLALDNRVQIALLVRDAELP